MLGFFSIAEIDKPNFKLVVYLDAFIQVSELKMRHCFEKLKIE